MHLTYINAMEAELLGALCGQEVSFAVVGGHAVLAYSSPERIDGSTRTLGDLDVLVNPATENLQRVSRSLASLRISFTAEQLEAAYANGKLPNLCGGYRAQLFAKIDGVDTASILRSAQLAQSSVGVLPVISKEHLMVAKKASGRPKDLEDLRALELAEKAPNAS